MWEGGTDGERRGREETDGEKIFHGVLRLKVYPIALLLGIFHHLKEERRKEERREVQ